MKNENQACLWAKGHRPYYKVINEEYSNDVVARMSDTVRDFCFTY